jgi:hypothetical protein
MFRKSQAICSGVGEEIGAGVGTPIAGLNVTTVGVSAVIGAGLDVDIAIGTGVMPPAGLEVPADGVVIVDGAGLKAAGASVERGGRRPPASPSPFLPFPYALLSFPFYKMHQWDHPSCPFGSYHHRDELPCDSQRGCHPFLFLN